MNLQQIIRAKNKFPVKIRRLLRHYSNPDRVLPDFLIIGAQKAGTTSLYTYLTQHPGIAPSLLKEIHFFNNPINRAKGEKWYRSHFYTELQKQSLAAKIGYSPVTGEATPALIFCYHAPMFISQLIPDVKLILLLRNPVDRAWSHYKYNFRIPGFESLTFQDAIWQEDKRIEKDLEQHRHDPNYHSRFQGFAYLHRGLYEEQLQRWFQFFPREQFCILQTEDFFAAPQLQLDNVLQFLNLPAYQFDVSVQHNKTPIRSHEPLADDVKRYLENYYEMPNQKLSALLNCSFNWTTS